MDNCHFKTLIIFILVSNMISQKNLHFKTLMLFDILSDGSMMSHRWNAIPRNNNSNMTSTNATQVRDLGTQLQHLQVPGLKRARMGFPKNGMMNTWIPGRYLPWNYSPWKIDGWKTILFFWGLANFQGLRRVRFSGEKWQLLEVPVWSTRNEWRIQ